MSQSSGAPWWRDGVFYQIYPRSFADSNGDGIGDLQGIISKLDYLQWLGIDGVWINPVMPSPNTDWGYDVSDFRDVDPELGSLADVDTLVKEAGERNIRIIFDLVPNHTSSEHAWFVDSRSSLEARHRDWYVWRDPGSDGGPPNNWLSVFGGSAWEPDETTGQMYLHNFLATQPDLNWWNDEVRDEFDAILRFWFDKGIAGFRIDVAHGIIKDQQLRNNLPATEDDLPRVRQLGQRQTYNMNRSEVHEVLKRWRALSDGYDDRRILVGETFVMELERMAAFYGAGSDELHLAFNFPFIFAPFETAPLSEIVTATERLIPPEGWPVWAASNHDVRRFPTRWCGNDPGKTRCAMMALLTLRGTPFIYYGDEIGMPDTEMDQGRVLDPVRWRTEDGLGRDPSRTPMHWSGAPGAGFSDAGTDPWLPFGDHEACNVNDQRAERTSLLHLTRDLITLRRELHGLRSGAYETIATDDGVWAWRRGTDVVVVLNLTDDHASVAGAPGVIRVATDREVDGQLVRGELELRPWQGVVVALSA